MTDNSLHSASVVERRPNLIADLVMGRITPPPSGNNVITGLSFYCARHYFMRQRAACWRACRRVRISISCSPLR